MTGQTTFLAAFVLLFGGFVSAIQADEKSVTAGAALDLMFRTDVIKRKGTLQRTNFNAILAKTQRNLQIAFVIDGTDSMGVDIASVLKTMPHMVGDLHRQKGAKHVTFSLVVYRDLDAKAGMVELPMGEDFTGDMERLRQTVAKTKTQTGSPYFPEMVDAGISSAIQKLNWSEDQNTSRWIIIFGDAPPYKDGFVDSKKKTKAKRLVATADLVAQAKDNKVTISCVVCGSGFMGKDAIKNDRLKEKHKESLPRLRAFMERLANETGGAMWDLTDPDIREALVEAANIKRFEYQEFAEITPEEVEEFRKLAQKHATGVKNSSRVRLAILPHVPFDSMTFAPEHPAVQVAAEMRQRFRQIPRVEVVNAQAVADKLRELKRKNVPDHQIAQRLAVGLRVDYVIWGNLVEAGKSIQLNSAIYKKVDGSKVAQAGERITKGNAVGETSIVFTVAEKLAINAAMAMKTVDPSTAKTFSRAETDAGVSEAFNTPIANSPRAAREIWAGFEALEQSLAQEKGKANELLKKAVLKLKAGVFIDSENPFAHNLLASAYFNLADSTVAEDNVQRYLKSLQKAYNHRDAATHPHLRTELEADYALLIERDVERAVELYKSLTSTEKSRIQSVRRAHWMLAGIFCGDWGVDSRFVDANLAREHILTILALFEDSPEAAFYKKAFQWDDKDGTMHPHYPKKHKRIPEFASRD